MTFEEAFRKVSEVKDIEQVANCSYLYEIEGEGIKTEEQVVEYARELFGTDVEPAQPESPTEQQEPRKYRLVATDKEQTQLAKIRLERNLTQKELSERTGIAQTEISKLEHGTRNPSIKLLQRLADGMGMVLKVTFIPKNMTASTKES